MQPIQFWDVIVIGGGTAGVPAAIASARNGAKTLIIEKNGYLGGAPTSGLVSPFANYHDSKGEAVIDGLFGEIISNMKGMGACYGPIHPIEGNPPWGKNPTVTPFDDEYLQYVLFKLAKEAGVNFLFHTMFKDTLVENGVVKGITVNNKSGCLVLLSKVIIDCTGNADVAASAGAKVQKGRESDGSMMPVTLYFKLGNVDVNKIERDIKANIDNFRWYAIGQVDGVVPSGGQKRQLFCSGFLKEIAKAKADGELLLGRETLNIFTGIREGEITVNATRVNYIDGTNSGDLIKADIQLRQQVISVTEFARKRISGFERAHLIKTAHEVGVRETNRIIGEYVINQEDVIKGKTFKDSIARGAYSIDIHNPGDSKSTWIQVDDSYNVPYRSLLPCNLDCIIVAGRCISATHEASAAVRVMPSCMAIGQAAGTAAALAVSEGTNPKNINVDILRRVLIKQGAYLL